MMHLQYMIYTLFPASISNQKHQQSVSTISLKGTGPSFSLQLTEEKGSVREEVPEKSWGSAGPVSTGQQHSSADSVVCIFV